jgi:short-subunit dehydrogenase
MRLGIRNEWLSLLGAVSALSFAAGNKKTGASLALLTGGFLALTEADKESIEGQSAFVTGGSRGLGLAIATELARKGVYVTIVARDEEELERARSSIEGNVPGAHVLIIPCDLTDRTALAHAIQRSALAHGGIDLLVNSAGAITVGPWESFEREDFTALLKLHFYAIYDACTLALPHLRASRGRRIVNIVSMGGKAGVPHMLPYDVSKFALAGFTQGLAAELAGEGISVTGVYPTVLRTGSPIQAVFRGKQEEEFLWFSAGASAPGIALDAQAAAKKIVRAAVARDLELVPSFLGKARNVGAALLPETFGALLAAGASALPTAEQGELKTGQQSRGTWDRFLPLAPLRWFARRAEASWNQAPRHSAMFNVGRVALEPKTKT